MMLFVLLLFATLAVAAPLDLPLDLGTFRNLTATNRCSDSADWQAYSFLVEDCYAAVQRLYIEQVLQKPEISLEFISRYGHHRTKRPWIRTPVQISVKSCTLTIMMLDWFGSGFGLPGRAGAGYEQTDTATFREIYRAVRGVEENCLLPRRRPGWDAVGTKSSIGVFLWATDSSINAQVMGRGGHALNDLPNLISPNASIIVENNIDSTK